MKRLLAVMFFLAGIVGAQVQHPGYVGEITGLPTCDSNRDGLYASITNGSTADEDCSTTGTDTVPCYCDGTSWEPMGSGGGVGQAYTTVQEEGGSLTQRDLLNFIGASVTCADNATKTDCTFTVDGVGYEIIQDEDSGLTQRGTLNFEGAGVACADDTTKTTCTITGGGAGTITVREVDLSPSVSSVDTIEFEDEDGFVVVDETSGVASVSNASFPLSTGRATETIIRGFSTDPASSDVSMRIQGSDDATTSNDSTIVFDQALSVGFDPTSDGSSIIDVAIAGQRTYGSNPATFALVNSLGATTGLPTAPFFQIWGSQYDTSTNTERSRFTIGTFGEQYSNRVLMVNDEYSAAGGLSVILSGDSMCFGPNCAATAEAITADLLEIDGLNVLFTGDVTDPYIELPEDSSPPGTCSQSQMVYDSTADAVKVCVDTSYQAIGGGGTPPPKCMYVTDPICNGATSTATLVFQAFAAVDVTEASCVTETGVGSSMVLDLQICDSDGSSSCTGNFGPTCGEVGTSTGNWTGTNAMSDNEWLRLTFTCTTDGHDWASVCFQVE